jgi:hypothetical protein
MGGDAWAAYGTASKLLREVKHDRVRDDRELVGSGRGAYDTLKKKEEERGGVTGGGVGGGEDGAGGGRRRVCGSGEWARDGLRAESSFMFVRAGTQFTSFTSLVQKYQD